MPSTHRLIAAPLLLCALLLVPSIARAQDSNYWTNQYGNEARLLGGIVVGSSKDVSAVYYNPGRLSLISDPSLVLAGNVVRMTRISLDDALGENLDLSSTQLGGVPSLFAGEIRIDEPGGHRLAYSFLTRHDFQLDLEKQADLTDLASFPSDLFTASVGLRERMNEYWAGLTWSYPLSDRVGVGISAFGLVRDHRAQELFLVQAQRDSTAGIALLRTDFDYLYIGALMKLGVGADLGSWRAGLTVTTPNIGIHGSGNHAYDESVVAGSFDGSGDSAVQIISSYQEGLRARYHSPTSVAVGVGHTWSSTSLDLSAEWFDGVDRYEVLDIAGFRSADGTELREPQVFDERKSVLNWGLGLERAFSHRVQAYLSFRTDESAAASKGEDRLTVSVWDIHHLAGGASFPVGSSSFTVGAVYAWGSEHLNRSVSLVPDGGGGTDEEYVEEIRVRFTRLTAILGFSISF